MQAGECKSLSDVVAYVADNEAASDAPAWPTDAVLSNDTFQTVWSWDFRGDDGAVPVGKCEGKALIGYDGTYKNPPWRIVGAYLSARKKRGKRIITLLVIEA